MVSTVKNLLLILVVAASWAMMTDILGELHDELEPLKDALCSLDKGKDQWISGK